MPRTFADARDGSSTFPKGKNVCPSFSLVKGEPDTRRASLRLVNAFTYVQMLRSPLPKSCELVSTARKHFRVPRIRPVELSSQSHRWTSQVEQSKQPARATPKQPLKLHKSNASASANPVTSAAGKQPLANANASNSNIAPASPKLQHGTLFARIAL